MAPDASLTRRGLLAVVGTSALAGCGGFDGLTGDREDTIRAYDLPVIDEESAFESPVQPSVPVDIEESYLTMARDRTFSLLASLPLPFGPDDVPNGHVRQALTDAADDATDSLDDALTSETQFAALRALRRARGHARYAAAGWRFVADELAVDDLRRASRRSADEARSRRAAHTYLGDDPVRATLVHARIEAMLERAADTPRVHSASDRSDLLTVAAWGEEAESARALVADAGHLDAQFTASLPDDAGTLDSTIRGAGERVLADVRSRRSALPPEPTADEWGVDERALDDLRRAATGGPTRVTDAPGPATALVGANRRLAAIGALHRLRPRLGEAEGSRVESAADLRSLRADAYDQLRTALDESPAPGLARTVVTDAAGRVASADWELARIRGETPLSRFDPIVARYLVATALARATPEACRHTVEAVQNG